MKKVYYITEMTTKQQQDEILLPLLETKILKDEALEDKLKKCDSLIFTSKNAILALESLNQQWHNLPCYVLGKGSNRALKNLEIEAFYVGSEAYGESFAKAICAKLHNKNPLFIRGERVASNLSVILKNEGVNVTESIVYQTCILKLTQSQKAHLQPLPQSVIFFSAPSRIEAFLENFKWQEGNLALCIGKTTAKKLQEVMPNLKPIIAPTTNIKECLAFAKTL